MSIATATAAAATSSGTDANSAADAATDASILVTGTRTDTAESMRTITGISARVQVGFFTRLPQSVQEELQSNPALLLSVVGGYATSSAWIKGLPPTLKSYRPSFPGGSQVSRGVE
ncbi:uncharacterized protein N7482_003802 [Penicillium canariense]|uniref:Uncharacterized protein n=1 Tax=Penicillium canariense TaxID=189055 RepID=A0A9W9I7H6_9EURO|nr:uncharacterized protein N7482_003802 [Penicillium canariense]KAJ5168208.1 hypothetical protein N7482_003802 [Penicillium canariense]